MVSQEVSEVAIQSSHFPIPQRQDHPVVQQLRHGIASMNWRYALGTVVLTLMTLGICVGSALANELKASPTVLSATSSTVKPLIQSPGVSPESGLAEGLYLYGDSAQSGVIGKNYWVFQVTGDRQVVGAVYAPYSSFDCFHGQERSMQLDLIVKNSYTQDQSPALVPLSNLKPISTIGDTDRNVLDACKGLVKAHTEANRSIQR